ncbi:ribosomal protein S6 kinase delta-1-like, partial [Stegodyphus dumicola]|uniref:ribosomal protein S6 kinase delta-1-like n=1 Tax=Stegodyphus dumicola TaxID=202533 RepID=UPI0015B10C26
VPSPLSESPTLTVISLKGSVQDLSKYKVLGILGKVLLVLDISNNCTYVVKTLYKSSSPRNMNNSHIIPQNIPFMVKIFQIYETNYALFIVLEHATGGRLWDYVSSYLQRSPLSPYNEDAYLYIEPRNKTGLCNVYSGKKISDGSSAESADVVKSVDSDLVASKISPSSYVALFKKYAVTSDKEEKVALAKYRRYPPMPCNEKSHLKKYSDNEKTFHDSKTLCVSSDADNCDKNEANVQNKKNNQQQRNSRNRLSSSTGSLESALSQKTCHLEAFDAMDEAVLKASSKPIHLPESCIYLWAAEIVVALDSLHKLGIIWMDFQPDNILLGTEGHILLTYQGYWNDVDFVVNEQSKENFFCAPEVGNIFPVTSDCDWWSLGVILYELLTGRSLVSCHPTGISMHTILNFPTDVSPDAKDFVSKMQMFCTSQYL